VIKIEDFDGLLDSLKNKNSEYDEHVLRLHLLGYSVLNHIDQTKLCWSLRQNILHGYDGLLDPLLIRRLSTEDPFDLRHCSVSDTDNLKRLVIFQINGFIELSRKRESEFDSPNELFHALSFTDPEAVGEDKKNESFSVSPQKLSRKSYLQIADYFIDEFYNLSSYHPNEKFTSLIVDQISVDDVDRILNLNCGCGAILLELGRRFSEKSYSFIEAAARNSCERFLCEISLCTIADKIGEPYVVEDDRFETTVDDYTSSHHYKAPREVFDLAIGIVLTTDGATPRDFDPIFYKLSQGTQNFENVYVELLLSLISNRGKVVAVVPARFLFSSDSRNLRGAYLSRDWILSISDVPIDYIPKNFGPMSIIVFDLSKKSERFRKVVFASGADRIEKVTDAILENNSDLDLRPSRFFNSVEYKFRNAFELFEAGYLDKKLKSELREIVEALDDPRRFRTLFNPCRRLLEAICHRIIEKEKDLIPYAVHKAKDGINLKNCLDYLSGETVKIPVPKKKPEPYCLPRAKFPAHVSSCVKICKELGDKNSHFYRQDVGINAYRSAVYALLETLEWFYGFNEPL